MNCLPTLDGIDSMPHTPMDDTSLTHAVRAAIERAPCSVNRLAALAGVPQSTLSRILRGERAATADVAAAVQRALEQWSEDCAEAAEEIRRAREPNGR